MLEWSHADRQRQTHTFFQSLLKCSFTRTRTIFPLDSFQHQGTLWLCKLLSDCLAWRSWWYTDNVHDTATCFSIFAQVRQCSEVCRGFKRLTLILTIYGGICIWNTSLFKALKLQLPKIVQTIYAGKTLLAALKYKPVRSVIRSLKCCSIYILSWEEAYCSNCPCLLG